MTVLNYYRIYSTVQAQNQYVFGLVPPVIDTTGGAISAGDQLKTSIINTINIPYYAVTISTGPYTALVFGGTITANTTTAAIVINLPASLSTGKDIYFIVNSGTNNLTLTPFGAETINAVATYVLPAGRTVAIQESGGNFIIDPLLILDQVESINPNGRLMQSGDVVINTIPTFNDTTGNSFLGSGITIDSSNNLVIPAGGSLSTPSFVVPLAAPTVDLTAATTNTSGSASTYNASDHTHAITTGVVLAITPDQTLSAGTLAPLARADHVHRIATAAPIAAISATASAAVGTETTFARSDHIHSIGTAAAITQAPGQANAVGTSAFMARADHLHQIDTGAPSAAISANASFGVGIATSFSRSDHIHTIGTAAAIAQIPDQTNAVGTSASMARADHVHQIATAAPPTILATTTLNATGSSNFFARADHVHAILTASAVSIGSANSVGGGVVTTFAASDHVHQGVHGIQSGASGLQYNEITITPSGLVGITNVGGIFTVDVPRQINQFYRAFGTGAVGNNSVGISLSGTAPTVWNSSTTFRYRGSTENGGSPIRFGVIYSLTSTATTFEIRLYNVTNSTTLATISIPATTVSQAYIETTTFANVPTGAANLEIQVRRLAGASRTLSMFSTIFEY